jgi:hypothetical protein
VGLSLLPVPYTFTSALTLVYTSGVPRIACFSPVQLSEFPGGSIQAMELIKYVFAALLVVEVLILIVVFGFSLAMFLFFAAC